MQEQGRTELMEDGPETGLPPSPPNPKLALSDPPGSDHDHHVDGGSSGSEASREAQAMQDVPLSPPPAPVIEIDPPRELHAVPATTKPADQNPRLSDQSVDTLRQRADSQSTIATFTSQPGARSSLLFVVTSLEFIGASKSAKRDRKLGDAVQRALGAIKSDRESARITPDTIFQPLHLATDVSDVAVVTTALDCLGKLLSYSYFASAADNPDAATDGPPLIERAIDTICDCFQSEATPVETQLQIVKSLLSAILNDKVIVHGAGLLKAVRLVYNIFLLSKSSANQTIAQGALTQMIGTVYERVKRRLQLKELRLNNSKTSLDQDQKDGEDEEEEEEDATESEVSDPPHSTAELPEPGERETDTEDATADLPVEKSGGPSITLQSFEKRQSFDDAKITEAAPTVVTRNKRPAGRSLSEAGTGAAAGADQRFESDTSIEEEEDEIFVRDAYLVFRAMCRLSTKTIAVEHALDVKSQGMRSKLLSLHIIFTLLNNHTVVFTSPLVTIKSSSNDEPTPFIQAIKQYLCLSLSRNGASSVRPVFEVSCEIFWLMLKELRVMLKKEVEVFIKEIYLAILEKRAAPVWQKHVILGILLRLAADARALVEVYLNYDCDRTAIDNMFERIVEHLSRLASAPISMTAAQHVLYQEQEAKGSFAFSDWHQRLLPPSLTTSSLHATQDGEHGFPQEYVLKQASIGIMVNMLRSLYDWSSQMQRVKPVDEKSARLSADESRESFDMKSRSAGDGAASPNANLSGFDFSPQATPPAVEDDPRQFDLEKQRKTALANAVRQFNFKPKRGIKLLIDGGFVKRNDPVDLARFLLGNEQINKAALGEYLGEGDEENIAVMHEFVDLMEFRQTRFVEAVRRFLQSFRLPGEAQKIDRFMLKFAERYVAGNPKAFANADTAYVLAYSVIMLNTDQHSANIKAKRMTPEDFIKNNRGINDDADLPEEYLRGIFDEIAHNEIVLDTEREKAANLGQLPQTSTGLAATIGQAVVGSSRDHRKEEYAQTEQLANRTEQLYKTLLRAQRRGAARIPLARFVPATSAKHVGPLFQVTWMPFFTSLTAAAQEASDLETVKLCIAGQRYAINLACLFDLEDPRSAFVSSMVRFTNLYNTQEMKAKNMEAIKTLLDIAISEGDALGSAWEGILTCVSQLDRFQLAREAGNALRNPKLGDRQHSGIGSEAKKSLQVPGTRRSRPQSRTAAHTAALAEESRSADVVRNIDQIFANTAKLSLDAILHFVRALTKVSWQEIETSGQSEAPRTYSLQKIVEVCNYNMTRVRFEWASIWQVLGEHFNQVGCHYNTNVVFFALDSLRQLSLRFFDLEELAGFKFQKDFLRPFEHTITNSTVVTVKDMVLRCLVQMIQVKGNYIRSGWKTMFGTFTVAAQEPYEGIVNFAYDHIVQVFNDRLGVIIAHGSFADLVICLTQFSKNPKFQKKGLQAIETLKLVVVKMLQTPECPLHVPKQNGGGHTINASHTNSKRLDNGTAEEQFWFPVLFAFHDILMTGDDLEIRSRALNYLFDTLLRHGGGFPPEFWDTLWSQLLYPIFMVLRSKSELTKMTNHEELAVWLSTTMIQALRNMVTLFTHFFNSLEYMLDRFLDLLILCICQENDTLARIGSNCLQQLILQNVAKFSPDHWHQIVGAFVELFQRTEATALFSAASSATTPRQPVDSGPKSPFDPEYIQSSIEGARASTQESVSEADTAALGINGLSLSQQSTVVQPSTGTNGTHSEGPREGPSDGSENPSERQQPAQVTAARRRFFNQIITKCVLSLLMIETVNELFSNDVVYTSIPSPELLRLMALLKKSYHFAKLFNNDRDLRTRLFREGFMKQPPNLLKQESGAAAVYVAILFRMYHDDNPNRIASREETQAALIPLCADIITSFIELDEESQARNIATWRPVVVDVLEGYNGLPLDIFEEHIDTFAPLLVGLLGRDVAGDLRKVIQASLAKVFEVRLGIETPQSYVAMTPRAESLHSRRGSRQV